MFMHCVDILDIGSHWEIQNAFVLRILRKIMAKRKPSSVWPVDNHRIHHTCIPYSIPQRGALNVVSSTNPHESFLISMTDGCRCRRIRRFQGLRMVYWHRTAWDTAMMWIDVIDIYYDSLSTHVRALFYWTTQTRNSKPYLFLNHIIKCFLSHRTLSTVYTAIQKFGITWSTGGMS